MPQDRTKLELVVANLRGEVIPDMSLTKFVRYLSQGFPLGRGRKWIFALTSRGTSLLIINCTFPHKLDDFEKLTRYLRENVNETCAFISMRTPVKSSSDSPSSSDDFFLPLRDVEVLTFLAGLEEVD